MTTKPKETLLERCRKGIKLSPCLQCGDSAKKPPKLCYFHDQETDARTLQVQCQQCGKSSEKRALSDRDVEAFFMFECEAKVVMGAWNESNTKGQ